MTDEAYRTTRRAWQRIWGQADLAAEHATGEYPRACAIRDRYLRELRADARILEAGCGVGTELLALRRRSVHAVGVDYAPAAVQALHRADATLPLAVADIHALPFAAGAFDAYLSFGVVEHFDFGPGPALREAHRVLASGGTLVLTVPAPSLVWRAVKWRQRRRPAGAGEAYYETTYPAAALMAEVRAAGFVQIVAEPVGHDFTLWGLGGPFRGPGHYETSRLAERAGRWVARWLPEAMAFAHLVIARKPS